MAVQRPASSLLVLLILTTTHLQANISAASTPSSSPKNPPLHISLSRLPRPTLHREFTFSLSRWPDCTPKTFHGFIATHTSTPVEEFRDCRNDGMTASSGDYFSRQKHSQMLSPDPTPYEAHGYLPLCSVAAVAENAVDYFVNRSDASTESAGLSENNDSCILKSEDDGEKKSFQTRQLEGYVHTSHLPLSEPSHQTKILVKEHGVVSGPGEDIEFGLRSSNGDEQHEGECNICDISCAGCASLEIDGTQSEVPIEKTSVEGNPVWVQNRMIGKVLTEGQSKFHALAKQTRWMKDQEDYQTFKVKLTNESQRKKCR